MEHRGSPLLELVQVRQIYGGRLVLDIPQFRVEKGERLVLFGPNGAGKSSLMRILALVEKPVQGCIFYQGTPVDASNSLAIRRRFVLLLQKPVFFQGTVRSNVIYGLKVRGLPRRIIQSRLDEAASMFSLENLLDRHVERLSGGEAQRVNLARAFILQPEILFLDEPFSPLDASARQELLEVLRRTVQTAQQTTVLVTHHREEVLLFGTRAAVLMDGVIRQEGSVEEVFSRPNSDEVARLVGVDTVLAGQVVGAQDQLLEVQIGNQKFLVPGPGRPHQCVLLCIRSENVILASRPTEGSVRNWLLSRIIEIHPRERTLEVVLDCGFRFKAAVTRAAWMELGLEAGTNVWAGIKATSIHLISQ
ncbi:MAG TPA: ABC transporter ATP-binding protein [Thermoguttaceae bacterium]|nr:ABC transporter ATP-binding protein [Thermoguttaceae bacterium]